jgi:hypothetical protein
MMDFRKQIKTHDDGTSHDLHICKLTDPGAKWCPQCLDYFGPAIDREFVAQLAPKVADFLANGHGEENKIHYDAAGAFVKVRVNPVEAPPLLGVEPGSDEWYIEQAKEQYASDEIEFDDALTPKVSVGEQGAWVAAWVFVAKPDEDDDDDELIRGSAAWRAAKNDHDGNYLEGE